MKISVIFTILLLINVANAFEIEFSPSDTVTYPTNTLVSGNSGWNVTDNITSTYGFFHGLAYYNNSIFGVTRTEPARLCRFNTNNLSDYACQQYSMAYFRDIKVVDGLLYVTSQISDGDATGYVRQIDPNNFTILNSISTVSSPDALSYCNGSLFTGQASGSSLAMINLTSLTSTTYSSEMTRHHGLLCDSDESKIYSTGYSTGFSDIQYFNTSDPNERNTRKVIIGYSFADDPSIDGEWIYICAEFNSGMLRINKTNFNQYEIQSSPNGCYGTYSDGSLIYFIKTSSPARIVALEKNLTIYDTFVLPNGFNSLNEYITDPEGNIYVTTWEGNSKVVRIERPMDNFDVKYQLYIDGVPISTNETFDNSTLAIGVYNYTYTSTEGENLTAGITTQFLYVLDPSTTSTTTVPFVCGNSICQTLGGETQENCCADCGCSEFYRCSSNVCILKSTEKTITEVGQGIGFFLGEITMPLATFIFVFSTIVIFALAIFGSIFKGIADKTKGG